MDGPPGGSILRGGGRGMGVYVLHNAVRSTMTSASRVWADIRGEELRCDPQFQTLSAGSCTAALENSADSGRHAAKEGPGLAGPAPTSRRASARRRDE